VDWLIYTIAGLTAAGLAIDALMFFHYGSKTVHRGQAALGSFTVLMLCFSILNGAPRG
jgi:hypothetical protein